ncbi:MAG: tyrosine-type recombinase/integrase, partial [Planctomycetaceae bacterium]|nr:tyrosine-type recombinase/integrase [Planctomycetaceae bacterium]
MMSNSTAIAIIVPKPVSAIPTCIEKIEAARFAWDEFFRGQLRNPHTRVAYMRAVRSFLEWAEKKSIPLTQIEPGKVGEYFDQLEGSIPKKKLHLSALRAFFDVLVNRHVLILNPAATVRGDRYRVVEGKTMEITPDQARRLLASIDTKHLIGRRDKAIIVTLIYTAARVGAVANLRLKDFVWDGSQYTLRFEEKGGQSRLIPVRHDLQLFLIAYRDEFDWQAEPKDSAFFRSVAGRTGKLTKKPLRGIDICRMMKRRLEAAGLPEQLSPHSFRVATVTDLLTQGIALEDVQYLAGHA